jgi:general secretion pathway protein K
VALVASVTTFLAAQNQVRIQQMENLKAHAQAELLARAAIDWGRVVLWEDGNNNDTVDHLAEKWTTIVPPQEADGGQVGGQLSDQQALFNLNNLMSAYLGYEEDAARFQRLLVSLQLSPDLANALMDWLDSDMVTRYPGGAEDVEYIQASPPHRAGNRLLLDVNELYAVRGFNADIIARLRPFVTVLPKWTGVNVNTASVEVLTAVLGNARDATEIVRSRKDNPIVSKPDFTKRFPAISLPTLGAPLQYGSEFFLAEGQARYGAATVREQALLQRNGPTLWPTVVWIKQR